VQGNEIAVIGMAGRFPGAADLPTFWKNLSAGVESVHYFTDEELRAAGETEEAIADPTYVKACPRLDGIGMFDAAFFGMSPRDAAIFDPQHRFFLECAWEAFEHAGYVGEAVDGPVGVFGSCGMSEYMVKNVMTHPEIMTTVGEWLVRHTGNDSSFLATRVSYELNLRGPSMSVQTACSSSLVAIHLACQSLLNAECDVALAGGSTIYAEQDKGYFFREGEIFSVDGHTRAFDARSAGTTMCSATGCVVLKRLADAERDGDNVLAVIRGSAITNDGDDKVGYLAPSVSGQARVVTEALTIAGISPEEISYIEAHGTGTRIGDPIEIAALTQAFRAFTDKKQYCALGSLKSNIGHAGEASGIAGFIKTVLALENAQIPPSLHYESPNPQCDLPSSPFFVNTKLQSWQATPRIAGITGLGAGGTNCHMILQEAPAKAVSGPSRGHQLLVVSAKTATALETATENLSRHLAGNPGASLADVAFTMAMGRTAFRHRRTVVAKDVRDAIDALATKDARRVYTHHQAHEPRSVAFLFPGGGAQYAGMARELYDTEAVFRGVVDECLAFIQPRLKGDLRALMFPKPGDTERASARLEEPSLALPALFTIEYAMAKLLLSWGITPRALIGHSAGEYAAACIAGVLSFQDGLALVAMRGRLFETVASGGMVSVQLSADGVRPLLGAELSMAAINAPSSCVVSGPILALEALEAMLRARDVAHERVHIQIAAHSAMLEPILADFGEFCRTIPLEKPRIPLVSNLTGTWITDAQATDPRYWVDHLRSTVRFDEGLRTLLDGGDRVLLEVGPGRTLSSLARQQPQRPIATATIRHPKEEASDVAFLLAALGRVWAAGEVDLGPLYEGQSRRRVELPTYPWERQRYWIAPAKPVVEKRETSGLKKRRNVTEWFYAPSWRHALVPPEDTEGRGGPWLVVTGGSPIDAPLVQALRVAGDTVVTAAVGTRFTRNGEHAYTVAPDRAEDFEALVDDLRKRGLLPRRVVHMLALTPHPSAVVELLRRASELPKRAVGPVETDSQRALASYEQDQARAFGSQAFLARALGREVEALHWAVVTEGVQLVGDDGPMHPERATALGVPRVIGRELPHATGVAIDVVVPARETAEHARLADKLARELRAVPDEPAVAYRRGDRFVQRFDPLPLAPATTDWVRRGAVVMITGGMGGIGLAVAEHIARAGRGAKLILVGRSKLPEESLWNETLATLAPDADLARRIRSIRALRALGTEVVVVSADVTDRVAVEALATDVRARFGRVDVMVHSAGVLEDSLLALREKTPTSTVLDAKVKGALVLDAVFGDEVESLVLFSSVSSILGLAGQADYTAANAFLDAFAHARRHRHGGRTVSINWNAWQGLGMAATRASQLRGNGGVLPRPPSMRLPSSHPFLEEVLADDAAGTLFRTRFDRSRHWLIGEHVVKGGEALIPGTGYLELACAAIDHRPEDRPVELRDVLFLSPFVVGVTEPRSLHVRVARGDRSSRIRFYSESDDTPHATATGSYVDSPAPECADLDAIRARCTDRSETFGGFTDQSFMAFGPRWANVRRIDYAPDEALITLALDDSFSSDVGTFRLHPALLDMATGGAQKLIPGFDSKTSFYVPFSYERVLLRRAMPGRLFSHVRLRSSGKDVATFDIRLLDPTGGEVADLRGFTMRRIANPSAIGSLSPRAACGKPETPLEAALREGILSSEGVDALHRILSADASPQIIASSVDLHGWLDVLGAAKAATIDGEAGRAAVPAYERPELSSSFLAPRTPIERELATMWQELLGVERSGVRDDFFELGGQSLVAVRLFSRIRKKYGVDLALSTLFEAPTIEGCAAILAAALGVEDTAIAVKANGAAPRNKIEISASSADPKRKFQSLVTIQRGNGCTPFFCVHGAGGNVLNFRDLSRAMGAGQPFYGFQARGIDGVLRPHDTVEEMARAYLEEVRTLQPHGPYMIGGYSGGGLVAFEMARRITESGEGVDLLALIDTFRPQMPVRDVTVSMRLGRLRDEGFAYFRGAVEGRFSRRRARRELHDTDRLVARGEPIPPELRDVYLTRNFEEAHARYRPLPWNGRAVLFRPDVVDFIYGGAGPAYGWDNVIAHLEIARVPGNHANLLLGPNAAILIGALGRAIEEAHRRTANHASPEPYAGSFQVA
jgi:acyl transferase domain-containing protein/thioesterase domain-containing protein/aryl carrier-like protein